MSKELEHSFVTQLEENQNIVHKICRLYTNDADSHNDLFQEITIQLWKAFPKFRGDSKFSTWMYRVGLNTAITLYRKSKRSVHTNTQDFENVSFKITADEYDDTVEVQLRLMYDAVKQLNDIDKALVFLYLEDKNYKEISDTLGITEVNARVKMNRIKEKLRTILNP
ncbi:RNA polymerase sigma factor [uncultured Planktosalinus sp.]|uniref:RNA polymerase sigma factor n=1 Tax=uncultured Planktosalinus sp. TaxID=1810935 RepID=UPI0030DB546F